MQVRKSGSTKNVPEIILLPGGIGHDIYLPDESIPFPKKIYLNKSDLENLSCSRATNFSFTHYGPPQPQQDKSTNEDFALSGQFTSDNFQLSRFAILADGISNGFGFSQRGAQLSCFAAYHCLRELHETLSDSNRELTERDINQLRNNLADKINEYFSLDREHLLDFFEAEHRVPSNISAKVWREKFKCRPEKWYGNTLLISFLSEYGGFVVYAGDGAIVLLKDGVVVKELIRSESTPAISQFVSVGVMGGRFSGAFVSYENVDNCIEIISATDGLDRTFQLNELNLDDCFSSEASLKNLVERICNIEISVGGEVDIDNYSISRVFFELQSASKSHSRMTGTAEDMVPVALGTVADRTSSETSSDYGSSLPSGKKKIGGPEHKSGGLEHEGCICADSIVDTDRSRRQQYSPTGLQVDEYFGEDGGGVLPPSVGDGSNGSNREGGSHEREMPSDTSKQRAEAYRVGKSS